MKPSVKSNEKSKGQRSEVGEREQIAARPAQNQITPYTYQSG